MVLSCEGITKQFGGLTALDAFDMEVPAGEITGLIGPNGAGKTTLFNVITGVISADLGNVRFLDLDITGLKPHEVCHRGIGRTFQVPRPLGSLSVEENVRIAEYFGASDSGTGASFDVDSVLEIVGLDDKRNARADALQVVEQKYLDLARALVTQPRLVLLDEIMAGLNPTEKDAMTDTIRRLKESHDLEFLVVEHDLGVIRTVSDRIVVMHNGRDIASGAPDEVLDRDDVRQAYVGE